MQLNTHIEIDTTLCGKATKLEEGYAEVLLYTTAQMKVDMQGLVHGGFIFSAADYAAMCAVNDPFVVLGSANSTFLAPVKVGDVLNFRARLKEQQGKKKFVEVKAYIDGKQVYFGTFTTFILSKHVLQK